MSFGNASPTSSINWTIRNCYITLNSYEGVRAAFGEQVLNNVLDTNGVVGMGGGTNSTTPSGMVVQGNTVTNNNYSHLNPGVGAGGIKFGFTTGAIIKNNIVQNNIGNGIHCDVGCVNTLIDGNTVTGNTDGGAAGIVTEISLVGNTVRNNIIKSNGLGATGPSDHLQAGGDSTGTVMYCNVIEIPNDAHQSVLRVISSNRGYNGVHPGLGVRLRIPVRSAEFA